MSSDATENLVDDLKNSRGVKVHLDSTNFTKIMDKGVMKLLLKFDLPIRRIFSSYAGKHIRLGPGLTWQEIKTKSIGMELDGFLTFCSSYLISPNMFSAEQCESMVRSIINDFPLSATISSLSPQLLYPQFQLILSVMALARNSDADSSGPKVSKGFARKEHSNNVRETSDIIADFLR